jgi:hypothetical protein
LPRKNGRLTASESIFAEVYAATGDRLYSGAKAGYKSEAGVTLALQRPEVQAEVERKRMTRLNGLVDLATDTIEAAMTAKTATWTNKIMAADLVLKRWEKSGDTLPQKEASDMSYDELQHAIRALQIRQEALANGARDVTPEPDIEPHSIMD